MSVDHNSVCIICARGGSQRLPNKNIKLLDGVPLIAYTIQAALDSCQFDEVVVSSDSDDIIGVAESSGATTLVKRSSNLASNTAGLIPSIQDAVKKIEKLKERPYETVTSLQPTSPLKTKEDVIQAMADFYEADASNLFSVTPSKSSPYFSIVEQDSSGKTTLSKGRETYKRSQDAPESFDLNGAIYIWKRNILMQPNAGLFYDDTVIYEMPPERSVDIDTELDFLTAECYLAHQKKGRKV